MCLVWFSKEAAITSPDTMFFVRDTQCFYCELCTEFFITVIIHINVNVKYLDGDYSLVLLL